MAARRKDLEGPRLKPVILLGAQADQPLEWEGVNWRQNLFWKEVVRYMHPRCQRAWGSCGTLEPGSDSGNMRT